MKNTTLLAVQCPGCDKRFDFINPPDVFTKLCGCGMFFMWSHGKLTPHYPHVVPTSLIGGSTTVAEKGDNTCANVDSKPLELKSPEKWG